MTEEVQLTGRFVRLYGPLKEMEMQFLRAEVRERLSEITEIDIEFFSAKKDVKLEKILGQPLTIEVDFADNPENKRYFVGHCIEVQYEGELAGFVLFSAVLRAWPWFLTRSSDCKIFQEKTAMEIIKEVLGDYGFDFKDETQPNFPSRTYCVQYRETDWEFVYRLMVEEGIYFYFDYEKGKATLVMVDDVGKHKPIPGNKTVDFRRESAVGVKDEELITEWREYETLQSGKVTLDDYFFEKPSSDLVASVQLPKGEHPHKDYEIYDYHGRFEDVERGQTLARSWIEALAGMHRRSHGKTNIRRFACGYKFQLDKHHVTSFNNKEYVLISTTTQIQIEPDFGNIEKANETPLGEALKLDERNPTLYRCIFDAQPASEPFRAPHECRRPVIPGLQTAKVVGPEGNEIYTEKYGRVKVRFFWDRAENNDEEASCWIRTAVPWSGKQWGMVWVPRIGQEVVVQFEEGDPDRPIIVGMMFNDETKHPYKLPDNMTQMGWTTRSTTEGGSDMYHELLFEDKKEQEFIRFQSERDYKQIVKNNAEITVGIEHADPGDMSLTVKNALTETVQEGDHTFAVETGNETYSVEGNRDMTVNGDHSETVQGSQTINVTGAISITSSDSITLTVGGSSITIDTSSITLSSPTIEVSASGQLTCTGSGQAEFSSDGMAKVGGAMVDVGGDAMVKIQGGICKIN